MRSPARLLLGGMVVVPLLAVAAALYTQYRMDMMPCAWCVLQRLFFVVVAAASLLGLLLPGLVLRRMAAALAVLAALALLLRDLAALPAVFCSSDLLALGVLTEAGTRGLAVPQRLAVVGFGDLEFAAALEPALTTVHIKGTAIGRRAAQFIVERAEGREVSERVIDIGFSIVERQST